MTPLRPKPNFNFIPNSNNSSNHCDSCNCTFSSRETYLVHLKTVHNKRRTRRNPNIPPDINDPNFYCQSCQHSYKSRFIYRRHLKRVHKMEMAPLRKQPVYDPKVSVEGTKNSNDTICDICKCKYVSKESYRKHMRYTHRDITIGPIRKSRTIINPNVQPDPNDPNYYCSSCQHNYSRKYNYRRHMVAVHPSINLEKSKTLSAANSLIVEVVARNPKNTMCTICTRSYANRDSYRTHMLRVHRDVRGSQQHLKEGFIKQRMILILYQHGTILTVIVDRVQELSQTSPITEDISKGSTATLSRNQCNYQ